MEKLLFFLLFFTTTLITVKAQSGSEKPIKKVITLLMPRTVDDDMPGTRGACVVWHPLQKKYYAAMAGNVAYPLGVFDATGKKLSADSLNTNADIRGLWYNPQKKRIEGNSYNDFGWFSYTLNAKGIPVKTDIFLDGMNQPDVQSVGVYSIARQQVLFLYNGNVYFYSINGDVLDKTLQIQWERTKSDGPGEEEEETSTPEDYNSTTVVFTGLKGAELGFLNITEMQIELYNIEDGFLSKKLKLPEEASMNAMFNFAYTNGIYWLYNIEERKWSGYK
jgi:hypothetical protein